MPVSVKIEPIGESISLIVSETLSPEAQKERIAIAAREILAEAEQTNLRAVGRIPPHQTFVDGRLDAPLESVRPNGGTIIFEFELLNDLFAWIAEQLVQHSPVLSGRYAANHKFFADRVELEPGAPIPPDAKTFSFVSDVPYARKIERGESPQAPDGVYESVAHLAQRRFGNIAHIHFTYQAPIGGDSGLESWASATKQRRSHNAHADAHWNRRQPAIVINLLR